jgi:hypothetical protein
MKERERRNTMWFIVIFPILFVAVLSAIGVALVAEQ